MFGTNTPLPRQNQAKQQSLVEIREAAAQLNSHIVSSAGSLPLLDRDLQQIENQTRNLYAKMSIGQEGMDPRAQYLLANKGFDAQRLRSTMTFLGKTATTEEVAETDLDRFLEEHHNQIILKAIHEQKRRTAQDYEEIMTRSINHDWEKAKRRIYEELGQHRKAPGGLIQDATLALEPREDFGVQSFAGKVLLRMLTIESNCQVHWCSCYRKCPSWNLPRKGSCCRCSSQWYATYCLANIPKVACNFTLK